MRWLTHVREKLLPGAAPPAEHVERDIDDEFAFHLAHLETELRGQGMNEETAREQARQRFGNEELLRRRCRAVAMKERLMLQKINVMMTVVLLGAVAVMAVLLYNAQRDNAMAKEVLMTQVELLRSQLDGVSVADAPPATFQALGRFHNQGKHILKSRMKLSEAVVLAEPTGSDLRFEVRHYNGNSVQLKGNVTARELLEHPEVDLVLVDGDIVEAKGPFDSHYAMSSSSSGTTGVVYVDGDVSRPGIYNLPVHSQLTVVRLLAASGVSEDEKRVTVRRRNDASEQDEIVLDATIGELRADPHRDMRVVPDDYIKVTAATSE
jgi:hypothetical protein